MSILDSAQLDNSSITSLTIISLIAYTGTYELKCVKQDRDKTTRQEVLARTFFAISPPIQFNSIMSLPVMLLAAAAAAWIITTQIAALAKCVAFGLASERSEQT